VVCEVYDNPPITDVTYSTDDGTPANPLYILTKAPGRQLQQVVSHVRYYKAVISHPTDFECALLPCTTPPSLRGQIPWFVFPQLQLQLLPQASRLVIPQFFFLS
jgi:hypothetical protein